MIQVMLAVNNENGNLSGYCDKIDIFISEDSLFELEPDNLNENLHGPEIQFNKNSFEILGNKFEFGAITTYVGNIMWNAYLMPGSEVLRLLKLLKYTKTFSPQCGPIEAWDWWEKLDWDTRQPF